MVFIRGHASSPNILVPRSTRTKVSAIDVTAKTTYERLVLVLGWRSVAKFASMPSASSSPLPPRTLQRLLDFPVFSFKLFPRTAPQKCKLLGNCGNLADLQFPPYHLSKEPYHFLKEPNRLSKKL